MSDLEKFKKFFAEYGIVFEGGLNNGNFYMEGDKVDIAVREGSEWRFDKDGNFIKVVEGV